VNIEFEDVENWLEGLTLVPGKVVIPISYRLRRVPKSNCWIPLPGDTVHGQSYCPSRIKICNHFPIDPGFAITFYKVQGRALRNLIVALSRRSLAACNLDYSDVYIAGMARVAQNMQSLVAWLVGHALTLTLVVPLSHSQFLFALSGIAFPSMEIFSSHLNLAKFHFLTKACVLGFSHMAQASDICLLLTDMDGTQESIHYISNLTPDPCTSAFLLRCHWQPLGS
jgi:hypothetical protein